MEECKLTKRPCRAAIKESVDKCKNPIALRNMYQIVELLRKESDDVEYIELSEVEYEKANTICDVLKLNDKGTRSVYIFASTWLNSQRKEEKKNGHKAKK